ncbi:MAG: ABC transporter ATP-binding protein [Armatimonadota bacterium]|nr:ABC transporter ATP-binding protein [Armatimonadota bacterium]
MNTFRRLLQFLKPHWRQVILGVAALVAVTLVSLLPPLFTRYIFDRIIAHAASMSRPALVSRLVSVSAWLAGVYAAIWVLTFTRSYVMHVLGERFILDLRKRVYAHLQMLSLSYFESRQTGELMSRVTNDSEVVEEFVTHAADMVIADALRLVVSVSILIYLSPQLTVVALVPAPLLGFAAFKFGRAMRKMYRTVRERLAEMNAKLQDNLSGIRVIKSFTREDYEYDRFAREATDYYTMRVRITRMWTLYFPSVEFVVQSAGAAVIVYGAWLLATGGVSIGTLLAFLQYMIGFFQPVSSIARVNDTIQRALAAADRIFEILDAEQEVRDAPDAVEMPPIRGQVEFRNVCFKYGTGEQVLTNIHIHAKPGEMVALVGPSGAGKTSIINLIPRLYDPTEGAVLVDGVDVRTVTQESLRGQIAVVLQDTFLFNGTVKENIAYGKLDATDAEVEEAARAANAHEFITAMTEGYETQIGERGIKLSGGQRQRLAIARAILADPKILILDEATSSVDSESEYLIHKAMDHLMQGRTTFVIAHRLSTVKHADSIITLQGGRVVETGDHKTLLEADGAYSQMYEMYERNMDW